MNLTEAQVADKIKLRLGYGARCLALSQASSSGEIIDHYAEATSRALDMFNQYINRRVRAYAYVSGDSSYIDLSEDDNLLTIMEVEFLSPKDMNLFLDMNVFNLTGRLLTTSPFTTGTVGANRIGPGTPQITLTELLMQRKSVLRARSLEPDWIFDADRKWLVLFHPAGPYQVNYIKAYPHTLATLPEGLKSRFLDAVEGYCRLTLADITGMFGGEIPGPTGPISTDTEAMRTRGDALVQKVEDYLRKFPIPAMLFEC